MLQPVGAEQGGNAALRLAGFEALAGLFLLMRGEGRLAAEFDALGLGVAPWKLIRLPLELDLGYCLVELREALSSL
jgi:hypothetical protein